MIINFQGIKISLTFQWAQDSVVVRSMCQIVKVKPDALFFCLLRYKMVHDIVKKRSRIHGYFWPWNFGLFYKGKWLKKSNFSKLAYFSSKSGKHMKQMLIPPCGGDVGMKKWSPFLVSGARSPIFGHRKVGIFPIFRCPKMGLRAPESKNGDHFFTATPP